MADTVGFAPTSEFSSASCLANKYLRLLGHVSILAEVVGFEPTPDFSARGFQDRPLSLLGTLPQCPRIRKRAVTFRSSGKQFLITVTIRSNPPAICFRMASRETTKDFSLFQELTGIRQPSRFISRKGIDRYFPYLSHICPPIVRYGGDFPLC